MIFALLLIGYSVFFLDRTPPKLELSQQLVVTATNGLTPFQIIKRSDVGLLASSKDTTAETSVDAVIGRYSSERIAKGKIIDQSKLNSGPGLSKELDGLRILNVRLRTSPLLVEALQLPIKIGIIPSPRVNDTGIESRIYEVYILEKHLESDGISAVIAATETDCAKLASFLGRADLIPVGVVN